MDILRDGEDFNPAENFRPEGVRENIHAYGRDEMAKALHGSRPQDSVDILLGLIRKPKGSAFKQLQLFKKHTKTLINSYLAIQEINKDFQSQIQRLQGLMHENTNKRWTPEEDNALIEFAAREESTMVSLSAQFGRTPGAIQSRISYLVGINRITKEIAGRFIGTLNGEEVQGYIEGELQ